MFRAKSLLDEILGEATGKQFSPVIQPAQSAPDWNALGITPQWDAVNALPHLKDQLGGLGYTGELYDYGPSSYSGGESGMDFQGGAPQVSAGLQSWLDANKYSLQGRYEGTDLQTRIADANGSGVGNIAHYESNDASAFERAMPYVIAAMGTAGIGQGLGLWGGGGIGAEAGGGLLSGEGAAQLAAADLAVTPEALAAITPEIGGAGEIAALGAGQVGALNPNMFANEGLAQLTANPPVVSAAELSGITPNVSGLGAAPANMFANEGAKQLAANPPTVTPAELSAVTPSVPPPVLPTSGVNPVRAGEIAGYQTNGTLPSSAAVNAGGGLLDTITGAAGTATQWLKDNPLMGRLLMSGAGALVSGLGGSGGGSAATGSTNYGPAKQWTSPIQSGLLSAPRNVQQVQPGGLLGGPGVANSGAWQWRK